MFNAIGYTYGGSGATFKVPDLRGEFIRGWDDARGVDAGRVLGSNQVSTDIRYELGCASFGSALALFNDDGMYSVVQPINYCSPAPGVGLAGLLHYYHIRPRNVALMPCIKY